MTKLIFVRHCEADGNINRIFHGRTDSQISENGRLQLEFLSERFKNVEYDRIYSSPLNRTMLTAQAVNKYHGLEIVKLDSIIEIDGGCWEGKRWEDLPSLYPYESDCWANAPHLFHTEGGESMPQVRQRMIEAVRQLTQRHPGERVVCVSHGCAIRNLICWAMGYEIERLNDVPWGENTAVTIINMNDDLTPQLEIYNDCSHLSEDIKTLAKQTWWRRDLLMSLQEQFST